MSDLRCRHRRHHPRISFTRALAGLALAALVAGCASLSPDGGASDVHALLADKPLTADLPAAPMSADQRKAAVSDLLAAPLTAGAAVRIALLNSPRIDGAMATLQLSDAERVRASSLPNPVFAFEHLLEGNGLEIDRALRINVLGLITLPWQARWAGQQHEVAKLEAAQAVLVLAADTRRAWVHAVAAAQSAGYWRDAQDAAEAGADLAHRMAKAGNWSALQRTREQLVLAQVQAERARADQLAIATREQLTRLMGLGGHDTGYQLPDRLPDLPNALASMGDVQAAALHNRLDVRAAQAQSARLADSLGLTRVTGAVNAFDIGYVNNTLWSGAPGDRSTQRGYELALPLPIFDWGQAANGRAQALYMQSAARVRDVAVLAESEAREASLNWHATYDVARRYRDEVLPLRRQVNEEMLLRYNGMLVSPWELLAETRATAMAVSAGIDAQRDFWLADTDLELALTGSSPHGIAASQPMASRNTAPGASGASGASQVSGAH